jgi:hypothetical protein
MKLSICLASSGLMVLSGFWARFYHVVLLRYQWLTLRVSGALSTDGSLLKHGALFHEGSLASYGPLGGLA